MRIASGLQIGLNENFMSGLLIDHFYSQIDLVYWQAAVLIWGTCVATAN